MNIFPRALALWIPFVVALTGVFGCMYLATQQNYRQSLNDPQIQLAEDAASGLSRGAKPSFAGVVVDIANSLDPWLAIYDSKGKPVLFTGQLHDAAPSIPAGLFDDTTWTFEKVYVVNGMKETRVTWQSKEGMRQALVIVHAGDKFVVAGRNMRVTEDRIRDMSQKLLFGWAFTNLATLASISALLFLAWL